MNATMPPRVRFLQGYEDGQKDARAGRDVLVTGALDHPYAAGLRLGHRDATVGRMDPSGAWDGSDAKAAADQELRRISLFPRKEKWL